MLTENLKMLFERDLNNLIKELKLYKKEEDIWKTECEIANSAGNLALHLVGNLQHFIGKELGKTNYVRHREQEFSLKNIDIEIIEKQIEETKEIIIKTLDQLDENQLQAQYPLIVFEKPMSTSYFLIHLATHLSYHLGQINYHRRLTANNF